MTDELKNLEEKAQEYDASQIQVLEGLEAVRMRPGMYIGSTSKEGLHHLVWEIVDNSIDEALAGFASHIKVFIEPDNSITVVDDGRGIPVDIQEKTGRPAVETVFTVLHAGGKFGGGGYKVSGGLHGVGSSVVNALSTQLDVKVYKNGHIHFQEYKRGVVVDDLRIIGETEEHGTTVHFIPDPEIFQETTEFDFGKLAKRFQELAFLNKGLRISIIDKREGLEQEKHYHYEGGITSYVKYINENKDVIFDEPIYTYGEMDGISVEVAMQYTTGYHETVMSFANNIHTHEGGTHEQGFRTALTRVINDYARQNKILKEKDDNLTGDDVREGLTAIISVKHPNPQFEGQTKTKLGNSEVVKITNRLFSEALSRFLLENPAIAKKIVEKDFSIKTCTDLSLLNLMGYLFLAEKDYSVCILIFEKYIMLAQESEDIENEHIGLHQLAMIYREQGDFNKALKFIQDEEKIIEKHFSSDNLKKAVNNYEQGYVRLKLNQLDEALKFMVLSLEQSLRTDDVISQACSYRGLGEIYLAFGDTQLAKMHFEKAIEIFKSVDESEGVKEIEKLMT